MASPFVSWMNRLLKECPDDPRCAFIGPPPLGNFFWVRGEEVEQRLLRFFRCERPEMKIMDLKHLIGEAKRQTTIEGPWRAVATEMALEELMRGEADVYFQVPLYHPELGLFGIADFILRRPAADGGVEFAIWDTKLALHPRPYFLTQLAAYAECLEFLLRARGSEAAVESIGLVLGESAADHGLAHELSANEVRPYFRQLWARFRVAQEHFDPAGSPPDPADTATAALSQWSPYAKKLFSERDDLALVAGLTRLQRRKLMAAGYDTMHSLASLRPSQLKRFSKVTGIGEKSLQKLRLQAYLQCQTLSSGRTASRLRPGARLALAALPAVDKGDVFFDLEGTPLPPPQAAREYLLGVSTRDGVYHDWWAHDAEKERDAFRDFLSWLKERRRRFPALHVYHYGSYEASAFRRLRRDPGMQDVFDDITTLFQENVLVDLYAVVKNSLALGLPGYGLKNIEHFYRPKRETEVTGGADSMVVYQQWMDDPDGHDWQSSGKLHSIRDYNQDDCESTRQLLSWLRRRCSTLLSSRGDASATDGNEEEADGEEEGPDEVVDNWKAANPAAEMQKALRALKKAASEACAV
ncbi:unnamed protein product [Polarella glacialis]|uniref:YprB ribonuclease H-like domain-containing protein n=1 Tax=Polarella glacialis TaxID=89957 RepID=A0A813ISI4_POLGL|nr:unnamed protein product [Polarella glacialis]